MLHLLLYLTTILHVMPDLKSLIERCYIYYYLTHLLLYCVKFNSYLHRSAFDIYYQFYPIYIGVHSILSLLSLSLFLICGEASSCFATPLLLPLLSLRGEEVEGPQICGDRERERKRERERERERELAASA